MNPVLTLLYDILIILIYAVLAHELSHIVRYTMMKKKLPKFRFEGWSFKVGNKQQMNELTDKEYKEFLLTGV